MKNVAFYYALANNIFIIGTIVITAYCYYYLAKQFMGKKRNVWLVGFVYFVVMLLLYYIPIPISNFVVYGIGTLSGFLVMYWIEREKVEQKMFLAITFFSLRWLSFSMESCVEIRCYQIIKKGIKENNDWHIWFLVFITQLLFSFLFSFLLLFFAVWLIQKVYIYKEEGMTRKELMLLFIPSLSGIMGYLMLKYYNQIYETDTKKSIYNIYGGYNLLCFITYAIYFGAILVLIFLFQGIKSTQREERQNHMLQNQIEEIKAHVEKVEKLYQEIRGIRHDMGNHIMILQNLYEKREYQEAKAYMTQLKQELDKITPEIKTGNPITDIILTEKQKEAEEKGIAFHCNFHYPQSTKINVFDISVILNNAITNAMENVNVRDNPYIEISSYREKNAYLIEVKNSFSNELLLNEKTGLPKTTKEEKDKHGFGLENIRRVAQKYFGDMDITQKDQLVTLTVMLMLE